jgi:hypothetical protein
MSINKKKLYLTNLFIIDWDDTLFPTTWVNKNNIDFNKKDLLSKYKLYFLELDKTVSLLLDTLNKIGDIFIVTNANINWIKSCLINLNLTRNTIINNKIRIVSARDSYSHNNTSPTEWKILTFQDIVEDIINKINKNIKPNTVINIISIGDAMYEYIALINLDNFIKSYIANANYKNNVNFDYLLKNIKFIEKPEFDCVIDQIQVLHKNSHDIVNKLEFIDLKFKV